MRILENFNNKREELDEQSQKLSQALDQLTPPLLDPGVEDFALLEHGRDQLLHQHDPANGGFGKSMKFAMPARLLRLLRHWSYSRRRGDNDAVRVALDGPRRNGLDAVRGDVAARAWARRADPVLVVGVRLPVRTRRPDGVVVAGGVRVGRLEVALVVARAVVGTDLAAVLVHLWGSNQWVGRRSETLISAQWSTARHSSS